MTVQIQALLDSAKRDTDICGDEPAAIFETLKRVFRSYMEFDDKTTFMGVYLLASHRNILVLGPYVGPHTVHDFIPVGKGVVGACAEKLEPIIIANVKECEFYLECCEGVSSEIVLPIKTEQGELVGVLDLDSHLVRAYYETDQEHLRNLVEVLQFACIKLSRQLTVKAVWQ